jgi:hypothetical protein
MDFPRRYSYNGHFWIDVLWILFPGMFALMLGYEATQTEGASIAFIKLDPGEAKVFFWIPAVFSGIVALLGPAFMFRRAMFPRYVELAVDALTLPHGFLNMKSASIPYADIKILRESRADCQTILSIVALNGQRYDLFRSMFEDSKTYAEVRDYLASRAVGNSFRPSVKY